LLTIGTRPGSYEVTGSLGAGAMGEVYRARDAKLKRSVALKILPPRFAADAERLVRFQREAEARAALNHPNIVRVQRDDRGNRLANYDPSQLETTRIGRRAVGRLMVRSPVRRR
jgi:hypothetical protein